MDAQGLTDLVRRRMQAMETGNAQGVADCYAPDGVIRYHGREIRGRDAIRDWAAQISDRRKVGNRIEKEMCTDSEGLIFFWTVHDSTDKIIMRGVDRFAWNGKELTSQDFIMTGEEGLATARRFD